MYKGSVLSIINKVFKSIKLKCRKYGWGKPKKMDLKHVSEFFIGGWSGGRGVREHEKKNRTFKLKKSFVRGEILYHVSPLPRCISFPVPETPVYRT